MAHIYIALVDTPGFFAALIRKFIKQRYIHVVISEDAEFKEAYSVGRRNPAIPIFEKIEKEENSFSEIVVALFCIPITGSIVILEFSFVFVLYQKEIRITRKKETKEFLLVYSFLLFFPTYH